MRRRLSRNRDLTPTEDGRFEEMGRRMNPSWEPLLPEGRRMGRADAFLDFVGAELNPLLEANYPVAGERSVLFGSSLGGLFAAHTLVTRPLAFDAYVIVSPGLWWDGGVVFRMEEEAAKARDDVSATVYLAAGEREEGAGIPGLDQWKLVTNTRRLADVLGARGYPGLTVSLEVLPGETHTSAVPVAMTRGLRAVL